MNKHQRELKIKMSKQYQKTKLKLANANFISLMQTSPTATDMDILKNQCIPDFMNELTKWIKLVEIYYASITPKKGGQHEQG